MEHGNYGNCISRQVLARSVAATSERRKRVCINAVVIALISAIFSRLPLRCAADYTFRWSMMINNEHM